VIDEPLTHFTISPYIILFYYWVEQLFSLPHSLLHMCFVSELSTHILLYCRVRLLHSGEALMYTIWTLPGMDSEPRTTLSYSRLLDRSLFSLEAARSHPNISLSIDWEVSKVSLLTETNPSDRL